MLNFVNQGYGRRNVHALVRVHHDLDTASQFLAAEVQPADVTFHIRGADFDLHRREAAGLVIQHFLQQLLVGIADPAAAAVDRDLPRAAAQDLPDGLVQHPGPGVPAGCVQRRERPALQADDAEVFMLHLHLALDAARFIHAVSAGQDESDEVLHGPFYGLRAVVEGKQIALPDRAALRFDFQDVEGDLGDVVGGVGDGLGDAGNGAVHAQILNPCGFHIIILRFLAWWNQINPI